MYVFLIHLLLHAVHFFRNNPEILLDLLLSIIIEWKINSINYENIFVVLCTFKIMCSRTFGNFNYSLLKDNFNIILLHFIFYFSLHQNFFYSNLFNYSVTRRLKELIWIFVKIPICETNTFVGFFISFQLSWRVGNKLFL